MKSHRRRYFKSLENGTKRPVTYSNRYRLHTIDLEKGSHFPDMRVVSETGQICNVQTLNPGAKVIRCVLNVSTPTTWKDKEALLNEWKAIPGAGGCTMRASEIIKRHEKFLEAGCHIEIIAFDLPLEELAQVRLIQTEKYRAYFNELPENKAHQKTLPNDFVLPVTFATLTPNARRHFTKDRPTFTFQDKIYPYATTYYINQHQQILNRVTHAHADKDGISCHNEAYKILSAAKKDARLQKSLALK